MTDRLFVIDLFCGAGGFSEAVRQVTEDLGVELHHAAINHWDPAIESHERNHPHAHQYHSKVEQLHPPDVLRRLVADARDCPLTDVPPVHKLDVDVLLVAGPECTHFSRARGGKPVSEQKRMSPWHVLDWVEKLQVDTLIVENVGDIQSWGPVEDGTPTNDASIFEAWVNALNQLGYGVDWTTLVAADYGDPTSRERFFLVGQRHGSVTFPEPTHGDDPTLPAHRTAADIIDWTDLGTSIWTRDLTEPRVHSPPKDTTMQRIAEGIRRHCDDRLEPFADALAELDRDAIRRLREERVVAPAQAGLVAAAVDEPFLVPVGSRPVDSETSLVKYYGTSPPQPVDAPLDTVTAGGFKYALSTAESILLRQQDGGHPLSVRDRPLPTIATRGAHALVTPTPALIEPKNGPQRDHHSNPLYPAVDRPAHTITADPRAKLVAPSLVRYSHGGRALAVDDPMPTIATERGGVFALSNPYLCPLYNPRVGQRPRTRSVDRPLMTVPASKSPAALSTPLVRPFVDDCQGPAQPVDEPLKTQPASDRYALVVPELWPWGLDVRYRMLQPAELKQAQGFPADYAIVGTKSDQTEQIGNAVPVGVASALVRHALTADDPSLGTWGGGVSRDPEYEVPAYEEVASDD